MARIAGVDLPRNKRIEIALTYIYGIGVTRSNEILLKCDIDKNKRSVNLDDAEIIKLREILEKEYDVEGDLRRFESINIKRLSDTGCIRGRRHRQGLPLRGQRTRTNARTRKGGKKTVAGKKKAPKK
uniref:ribosomal protein S13 n=1 Tax=Madagascaria erythrocladioides TaxID=753684 RepID=UPI001BF0065B|nr:ribosomal protein S13 [Madagascaria erythrocladioides]QUE29035.1 ribosomal protein S13 [Madagascaria erythrocladioides]UNJ16589.1 ribosomal protein S13 [Madagascaria erythrocladioides]